MKKDLPQTELPSITLNGHYIKELTFDNINSPASFLQQNESPKVEIAINFNNRSISDNLYEVFLIVKVQANSMDEGNLNLFDVKLAYAGLFTINNVIDDEQKESILMIHCPTLLFPYARRVLSDLTRDGGFQPIMLEHMDFAALHAQRKLQKEKLATDDVAVN